jgi:hypothetical protein
MLRRYPRAVRRRDANAERKLALRTLAPPLPPQSESNVSWFFLLFFGLVGTEYALLLALAEEFLPFSTMHGVSIGM